MNSGMSDFALLADNHIEPVIFSMSQLSRLLDITSNEQHLPIHIKLDTGMRRLDSSRKKLMSYVYVWQEIPG